MASCQLLLLTPSFPPRGTSYTFSPIHKDKDHFCRPWLVRALPAAAPYFHSIPPCAPVPALFSCDAGIALPDRPWKSKRVCAAEPAATLDRHPRALPLSAALPALP